VAASTAANQEAQPDEPVIRFSRPIFRLGQDFRLGRNESVREIDTVLADVTVDGTVEDDVVVVIGSLRLTGTARVAGSIVVVGGTVTVDPGASVGRDMVLVGGELNAPPDFQPLGQQVIVGNLAMGNTLRAAVPWVTRGLLMGRLIVPDIRWMWTAVAVVFFVYFILNLLFTRQVGAVANTLGARPLSSFLLGLLVLLLTIPAIVILAATVIGIAIVPFVLCAIVVGALIGKVGVLRAVGRSVLPDRTEEGRIYSTVAMVIGFAVITTAYVVPVIGFLTFALTGVIGLGAAATTFRGALRREQPPRTRVPQPSAAAAAAVQPQSSFVAEPAVVAPVSDLVPEPPAPSVPPPQAAATAAPAVPRAEVATDLGVFPRATFLDRVAAFTLDAILVAIAVNLLELTRRGDGWFPMLLLAYHIAFWAWRGTTLGGVIVGLRVVRVTGTDLRFADALVRGLSGVFSIAALGIGCLWMLQDAERQMWHDKIAGTLVVKVPRHLVLP
jgi:uncharacterized RDD family membrane protein YckC